MHVGDAYLRTFFFSFSYLFSWERTRHLCQLRRRYVHLYATLLQQASNVDISEIREIEKILDMKVIILWRCVSRQYVLIYCLHYSLKYEQLAFVLFLVFYSFRLLGHAKVETVKSKETLQKKACSKRSWWPFGWFVKHIDNELFLLLFSATIFLIPNY